MGRPNLTPSFIVSQERDNDTVLDYLHARYFASAQGRFSSADSVAGSAGNPQSLNRYAYVNNNPLNFTDPTGHMPSIHTTSTTRNGEGAGWGWDDPTSPDAVLGSHTALPADTEAKRSQLFNRELAAAAEAPGNGNVTASAEVTGVPAEAQYQETGESLAKIAMDAFTSNPGLFSQIEESRNSAIPMEVVACQAAKESSYAGLGQVPNAFKNGGDYFSIRPGAAGEVGLLQVKPASVGLTANALENVRTNVQAGTNYLASVRSSLKVGTQQALVAYNMGPTRYRAAAKAGKLPSYSNSNSYAAKIMDCSQRLRSWFPQQPSPFRITR